MASMFRIGFDVSAVEGLAERLAGLTPERAGALIVEAINDTADTAYELSRKAILSGINLTDEYVKTRMVVEKATAQNPTATITALGGKEHITQLSHYGAMQRLQAAHSSRAKGDPQRGIPRGMKADGMSVSVNLGSRKPIEHAFTMPGLQDRAGNPLVFTRDRNNKIKSRKGPSVYQLFKVAGALIENRVYDDLERNVADAAQLQFERELS